MIAIQKLWLLPENYIFEACSEFRSVTVNLNSCLFLVWQSDCKMPAKIKVRIVAARDLPVMDRSSDLADAFAEVRNA